METPFVTSPDYYLLLATGEPQHAEAILRQFTEFFDSGTAAQLHLEVLLLALKNDSEPIPARLRSDLIFFYQQSTRLYKALEARYGTGK
ncbi:MAG TPA: hypothetical protein PKC69_03035 [Chitinophagaceae bacterium]|nr:hypothetical protein [Chitinophagaceae bacterium]